MVLDGANFSAKIDTGADLNFIRSDVVSKLRPQYQNRFQAKQSIAVCANKSKVTSSGTIELPIYIQGQRFAVNFLVMEKSACPMFLGLPFLTKHRALLDFKTSKISLHTGVPVHSPTFFEIQPFSEVVCSGMLYRSVPTLSKGECSVFPHLNSKGILVAKTAVTAHDNLVAVRLFNATETVKKINKGERIATFQLWDDDSDVCLYEDDSTNNQDDPQINSVQMANKKKVVPDIDWDQSQVNEEQKQQSKDLVSEFSDCFVVPETKMLGLTDKISCKIETVPGSKPVHKYPYRTAPPVREEMDKIVNQQIDQGLIEEAHDGAWASPVFVG